MEGVLIRPIRQNGVGIVYLSGGQPNDAASITVTFGWLHTQSHGAVEFTHGTFGVLFRDGNVGVATCVVVTVAAHANTPASVPGTQQEVNTPVRHSRLCHCVNTHAPRTQQISPEGHHAGTSGAQPAEDRSQTRSLKVAPQF